jgi:hypothetical protein
MNFDSQKANSWKLFSFIGVGFGRVTGIFILVYAPNKITMKGLELWLRR